MRLTSRSIWRLTKFNRSSFSVKSQRAVLNFGHLTIFLDQNSLFKIKCVSAYFSVKSSWEVHWIIMFQMDLVCSGVTSLYSHSYFIQGLPDLDVWIIPNTKIEQYWSHFLEGIIKNQVFHGYLLLFCRGCWSQPKLLFWKLVDETQMSKLPEVTRQHDSIRLIDHSWFYPPKTI